jgi:hypothetical protein
MTISASLQPTCGVSERVKSVARVTDSNGVLDMERANHVLHIQHRGKNCL